MILSCMLHQHNFSSMCNGGALHCHQACCTSRLVFYESIGFCFYASIGFCFYESIAFLFYESIGFFFYEVHSLSWTESRTRLTSVEFHRYVRKANGVYRPFSCLCRHSLLQLLDVVCDDLQECPRPEAFADDMEQLFKVEAQIEGPKGIDVDKVSFRVLHYGSGYCIMV